MLRCRTRMSRRSLRGRRFAATTLRGDPAAERA